MKAGTFDRLITLQRKSVTQSASGAPSETWTTLVAKRWASVKPVRGSERFSEPQIAARQQVEFRIRWSENVADLSSQDRIIYPATTSTPSGSDVYDIIEVNEIGRREGLQIIAVRQADNPTTNVWG